MKKAPISVRIIYVLSVISFWMLILITVVSFVINILLQTSVIGDEFQLRVALPGTFEVEEVGIAHVAPSDELNVKIEDASGQLYIVDTPIWFSKFVLRALFIMVVIALYMTWKFKLFIENIKHGIIFDKGNISNLKHISYGILVIFILSKIYEQILYHTMVKYIEFETITLAKYSSDRSDMLIIAMLIWIIAHVFIKGVEMKEEQELTI